MKIGDLVQVLPAKIGYYIILGKAEMRSDYGGNSVYWGLFPFPDTGYHYPGPMDEKFIEVISESR